jgi:hypothetical protein
MATHTIVARMTLYVAPGAVKLPQSTTAKYENTSVGKEITDLRTGSRVLCGAGSLLTARGLPPSGDPVSMLVHGVC